jgi:release factor glutamine methyltransferase
VNFTFSNNNPLTIKESQNLGTQYLSQKGIENARKETRLLLSYALDTTLEYIIRQENQPLEKDEAERFFYFLKRRGAQEPLSKIRGIKEFWSLPFFVNETTLDPRPDSETLIETVFKYYPDHLIPLKILDFGTGTGCLLLTLLKEYPHASGVGVDISEEALHMAMKNAKNLNLEERCLFLKSFWGDALEEEFDLIITNPPYIPDNEIEKLQKTVKDYDPVLALKGGKDGLDCFRKLSFDSKKLLEKNGILVVEIGQGQERAVENIFNNAELENLSWHQDLAGIIRCGVFKQFSAK